MIQLRLKSIVMQGRIRFCKLFIRQRKLQGKYCRQRNYFKHGRITLVTIRINHCSVNKEANTPISVRMTNSTWQGHSCLPA